MEGAQEGFFLVKQLASSDKSTRDKALNALLKTWLPNQSQVSDEVMRKLWKGLFYCVWHADKAPVQSQLIERLSSVLTTFDLKLSVQYFSVFLLTMRREWSGIDRLRLDKFYLLIRRFLHCFFSILKNHSWDLELTTRLITVLIDGTFLSDDKFQGNGVNYHIASVFLEELRPFLPVTKEVMEVIFGPVISLLGKKADKVLVGKITSNMFDVLLKSGKSLLEIKKSQGEIDESDDVVVLGSIALTMGFSTRFYDLGSSPDCFQGNRKALFGLNEEFSKLEKDLVSSGVEVSLPEGSVDEDEVPELVPIPMEVEGQPGQVALNKASKKLLKKCKKDKKESGGSGKKSKKNKKAVSDPNPEADTQIGDDNGNLVPNGNHLASDENSLNLNETAISNLQLQFEKVAAEVGLHNGVASACDEPQSTTVNGVVSKKRKRVKKSEKKSKIQEATSEDAEVGTTGKSVEKSAKRVRFSMKNNLVWKPQTPLPPQSLRLPPSATPRGSALKQGLPAGPVKDMLPAARRVKRKGKAVRKVRKVIKNISPGGLQRLKKLKTLSPQ